VPGQVSPGELFRRFAMVRVTIGLLGVLLCLGVALAQPGKEEPKDKPRDKGVPSEKIDPRVSRSLTGIVEKVVATEENSGTLKMRSSGTREGKLYQYTFQIDARTKILTSKGETLKGGLKSPLLARAEVRVVFVDRPREGDKPSPDGDKDRPAAAELHMARTVQVIRAGD